MPIHTQKTIVLLTLTLLPAVLLAQPTSVVTLFSHYCEQFDLTRGKPYLSCEPAFIRQSATIADEGNGYLEISKSAFAHEDAEPIIIAAHFIDEGTHLQAVATYENSAGKHVGQALKIYQWTGSNLKDVTRQRFAQKLSADEANKACDDYGGDYNFETKTWEAVGGSMCSRATG